MGTIAPRLLTTPFELQGAPLRRIDLDEALAGLIADQVGRTLLAGRKGLVASVLDRGGLASSILVRDPDSWCDLLVRFFPYPISGPAGDWRKVVEELFDFEREHWERWDAEVAPSASDARILDVPHLRSPWELGRIPARFSLEIGGQEVPALARRYLPWPSVRDAMLGMDRIEESVRAFHATVLPRVISSQLLVPVDQVLRWIRQDDPHLSRDHLLTDGTQVVPTRWRTLCQGVRQVTLADFERREGV